MNLSLDGKLEAFRSEVREFLVNFERCNAFFHHEGEYAAATRELNRALGERNWLALGWPEEVGGLGLPPLFEFTLWDEMARARAARPPLGSGIVAKTIIAVGTEEQKDRFLPGLRLGNLFFSLGYSEPEAGSDLAGLCRTGSLESRGRGLTILIVDRQSPGISISPIMAIDGERFNEVHFDEVRIPVANRIGPEGEGWRIIGDSLATERHVQFPPARVRRDFDDLTRFLSTQGLMNDQVVRYRMAELATDVAEVEAIALVMCEAVQNGREAILEAAQNKLIGSEVCQRIARLAGDLGVIESIFVGLDIEYLWRQSISETIGGGTSEIMRGLIARHGLQLQATA